MNRAETTLVRRSIEQDPQLRPSVVEDLLGHERAGVGCESFDERGGFNRDEGRFRG